MNTVAAISGSGLLEQILVLLIIGIVIGLILWMVNRSPVPEPFKQVLAWICYAAGALILINFLLGLIGRAFIVF